MTAAELSTRADAGLIPFPLHRLPSQSAPKAHTAPPDVPGRYAPAEYTLQAASPCGRALVLYNPDTGGRFFAMGFLGRSAKPAFHLSFRGVERQAAYIGQWLAEHTAQYLAEDARKATRKADKAAWQHGLTVGTILHYSWGYDQTQADFFEVVAVKGKSVVIRQIASAMVPDKGTGSSMAGYCLPCPGEYIGPEQTKIPQPASAKDGDAYLKMNCGYAHPTGPSEPKYCSWYA